MALFDETSILRGIETTDVASIRRIMNALMRRLAAASAAGAAQLSELNASERMLALYIFQATRGNGLLEEMVRRFASARYSNSRIVIQYAADLDRLAIDAVQDPDSRPPRELIMAEEHFNQTIVGGEFDFRDGGDEEYGDIEPDSNSEYTDADETEATQEEEKARDDQKSKSASGAQAARVMRSKNTPLRPPGSRCIDNGNLDREDCILGYPDPSKLSIVLGYEVQQPKGSGNWVYGGEATYHYRYAVDWNNKKSVIDLQKWRSQQFTRQIGPKNEYRALWLESERDLLISILEEHLNTGVTRGRWSSIVWDDVAAMYNSALRGKTQRAGEMTAQRHYNKAKDREGTSIFRSLAEDRPAPERTMNALRNQLTQFTGERVERLIREAKSADDEASSDDDKNDDQNPNGKKRKGGHLVNPKSKIRYSDKGKGKAIEGSDDDGDDDLYIPSSNSEREAELVHRTAKATSKHKVKAKAVQGKCEEEEEVEEDEEFNLNMEEAIKRSRKDKDRKDRDDRYGS